MNKIENIIKYADMGEVRYVNSNRAKNLAIRINQQGEVRVTIPRYISHRKAETFLMSKRRWIMAKLNELETNGVKGRMPDEGDEIRVRGNAIPVVLQNDIENIEEAIWRMLLKEASEYLPSRVNELAGLHGFEISGVKVRRMKTRWGSCTTGNTINLNSWLVMLPDYLSDYVILHELVHTRHRDHSKRFWEALDRLTPTSSKILRKELRSQRIMSF
jgi:predicted metal-dependent hydrolase